MATGQKRHVDLQTVRATDATETQEPKLVGSAFGVTKTQAKAGETETIGVDQETLVQSGHLVATEVHVQGQCLNFRDADSTITALPQDLSDITSICGKAASDNNTQIGYKAPKRDPENVVFSVDFAASPSLGADGDHQIRDFVPEGLGNRWVYLLETTHDGNLAPATSTIALGDGTGANDQLLAATVVDNPGLLGANPHVPATIAHVGSPAAVQLSKLVMRVALGPITAGKLTIRCRLADV